MVVANYDNICCCVLVKEVRHEPLECHDADIGCVAASDLVFVRISAKTSIPKTVGVSEKVRTAL